jgi:hypothetical protein
LISLRAFVAACEEPGIGVTIPWRATAQLGRDEQDDYCLHCLSAMETEQERYTLFATFQGNETA